MTKTTIQEMANALGLSRNTVSLALKGSGVVSGATRQRVYEYARRVGYLNQTVAPAAEKPQYQVMVLRQPKEGVFWDKIMSGLMKEAREENCLIQIAIVLDDDVRERRLPVGYKEGIDAFLFLNVFPQEYIEMILRGGKRGIFLDGAVQATQGTMFGDMVKSEGAHSVQYITTQLIAQGLKKIEFLCDTDVEECQTIWDRLIGYQKAMELANLPATTSKDLAALWKYNVYNVNSLGKMIDERKKLPQAFVCSNDVIAERLIHALALRGIKVPEDVAVTGFDNSEEKSVQPFITTADFHGEWLGRRMIQQLMWRIQHPDAPHEMVVIESEVIFRESSKKYV